MRFSFVNAFSDDEDEDDVQEEKFVLQAELIRRQVEHELDGESDEPLLYFFKASDHVNRGEIEQFIESLSAWDNEVFVYRGDIEHIPDDELRSVIKDVAPQVGLSVEDDRKT